MRWVNLVAALGFTALAFGGDEEALLERSRKAAKVLVDTLLMRLNHEFAKGGAPNAVKVCSQIAQDLTAKIGKKQGVSIRRVSLKNRNPKNKPDDWEAKVLRQWEKLKRQGKPIEEIWQWQQQGNRKVFRYMKPIIIAMPLCLNCHGDPAKMDAKVKAFLKERYPDDKAVGYRLNDLRGAVSVTITP